MKTRLIKSPPGTVTGYKMPGKKTLILRSTFGESSLSFYVTCTAASPDVLADVPCKNHFEDPLSADILLIFLRVCHSRNNPEGLVKMHP
jgi:hypothetical protein